MSQKNEICVLDAEKSLMVTTWNNQRVITASIIDDLHGRVPGTAKNAFARNKKHFIFGVDYFTLRGKELEEFASTFNILSKKVRAVTLFTQTGYLMLTKPMADDLSWQVQRLLVTKYFQPPIALQNPFSVLREVAEKMEAMYGNMTSASDYENLVEVQDEINSGFENRLKALEGAKMIPMDEVSQMVGSEHIKLIKSQYEAMQMDMTNMKMELAKLKAIQMQNQEKNAEICKVEKLPDADKEMVTNDYYKILKQQGRTFKSLAKRMGLFSMYGEPHHKFTAAIAKELNYQPGDGFMTDTKIFPSHRDGVKDFFVSYLTVAGMNGIAEHFARIENEYSMAVRKGKEYRVYELGGKRFFIDYKGASQEAQEEMAG
jgi:hypothetical protein